MAKTHKRAFGDWGEQQAASFLIQKGYTIIKRNHQIRQGEIDIIAWHQKERFGKTLCFIEVKTRKRNNGNAERATGYHKQMHLFKAAQHYCMTNSIDIQSTPIQFEQVSVYKSSSNSKGEIQHFVIPVS